MSEQTTLVLNACPFEEFAQQNGMTYWSARWLMQRLDYASWSSFFKVLNKAIASCVRAGLPVLENFQAIQVIVDGRPEDDYKLSRFACFLVVQHADIRKPAVEEVRTHLAAFTAIVLEAMQLERLEAREHLAAGESAMAVAASGAGVPDDKMAIFKDAGYRGLYNMSLRDLKTYKGFAGKGVLYDFMGLTEMGANIFRVTQTAERLKHVGRAGLPAAKQVAQQVGKEIRATMARSSGVRPEDLPLEQDINQVRKGLKTANRELGEADKPKKLKKARSSKAT